MGLGRRNARQHETVGFQKNALDSSVFWEYKPQQQVMTVDGVPGVVTAVLDGPYPGTEEYEVTLDNGLGGGSYTASQLQPLAGTTASHDHEATGLHTADQDYPELGSILHDRPPIERMTFSAARGDNPFEIRQEINTGGTKFPRRVDMTAHHPETGEEAGRARYYPPKRRGGPISIDEVKGHAPGAASVLLNEIESRHPGSSTKFLHEVKRNNNNPDVTGHAHEHAGQPTDWDTHYPNLAPTIHRGLSLSLPSYSARTVNSSGGTKDEHLAEIHAAMPTGPNVGTHWTENEHAAQLFAHNAVSDHRTDIPVVLHASTPAKKDLETRRDHLYRGGVFPYGDPHSSENEIPVRRGRDVAVTGISWRPDAAHPDADENGWLHHTYSEPMHHTAAMEDVEDEGTQEAEPELPPCAYCGSDQVQIAGDNGRAQQAKCQVCGGMMSAPYGLQFKPELIGDPSNHPKDDPDPASGGVPGAANMRVPVKRMNDSDYTASLHTASDDEQDASYRMQHQAPDADYGAPLHDVENMMPDFYDRPHLYNHGQEDWHTSASKILKARGNPEAKVRIYRSLEAEHAGKGFNTGDWVSTSKDYARLHGMAHESKGPKHDWPVISTVVPAKHLHTEGDVHEWAYNGPHQPNASVAFKGGYHQEIRQRADGSIAPVQRKANPFKERAEKLKNEGYSFSHYRPGNDDPHHTVTAFDPEDNWVGMVKAHENGEVHHVEIDPEHAHQPLEEHMRDMIARETKKTGSLHEAGERDWCTFRYNARCFYPGPLNAEGIRLGTPQDRGPCAWDYWQQQVCPISEPGPMALMQAKGSKIDELQDPEFRFHFTASWSDVRAKARRIRSEGQVNITVATNEGVGGEVKGDHHVYETVLTYVPGTYKVGAWECGCKWAAYAWGRSPAYKRFEGRMCSHALAMQFEAQAKGMFSRAVEPSTERPKWLRHHTPVVTQFERDSGENLTRRAVPPGNMRRTYEGGRNEDFANAVMADCHQLLNGGVYADNHGLDLVHPPVYAYVIAELQDPVDAMNFMAALGMSHSAARAVVKDATAERATGELHFEASLLVLAEEGEHEERERKRCPDCGSMISVNDEKCPHCHHVFGEHEHHHGAKTPAEGDLMSRGMVIGGEWDKDAVHRVMNGNATAHDLLHHIDKSDVGDFWYPHDPSRSHEDNLHGAKEFAQAESSDHPAQDLDRDRPIGETGMVLVGHKPEGWDPKNNPDEGLMGNSYIPHSADVPLHQIHYHDHNGDWHSADATGHSVHVHGGGYDRTNSAIHQGAKTPECPTVAGVVLKAADTGRILMLQRGLDDEKDPARGTWEAPGGHIEPGDLSSLHAGVREWEEETGQPFPEGGVVHHVWTSPNGVYQGHLVLIPEESAVQFHDGRQVVNPDNPDGDCHEQAAWWDVDHARKNPALREELKTGTPWKEIKAAGNTKTAATADPLYGLEEASPMSPPQHSRSQNPASTGWATAQDPHSWDDSEDNATNFGALPGDGFLGSLHDEPEAALPSTDGAESELEDERDDASPSRYDENDAELTPNTTLASAGSTSDIVARFQATAAASALGGGKDGGSHHAAQQANNKEIARAAQEFLTKRALKDFNFAEQQELINEGARDKTMARNSDVLDIEGTHYNALEAALAAEEALEDSAELFV
jgi:8-oxo-dGTP pyrophosphatase MutT (NUDIX family)